MEKEKPFYRPRLVAEKNEKIITEIRISIIRVSRAEKRLTMRELNKRKSRIIAYVCKKNKVRTGWIRKIINYSR